MIIREDRQRLLLDHEHELKLSYTSGLWWALYETLFEAIDKTKPEQLPAPLIKRTWPKKIAPEAMWPMSDRQLSLIDYEIGKSYLRVRYDFKTMILKLWISGKYMEQQRWHENSL